MEGKRLGGLYLLLRVVGGTHISGLGRLRRGGWEEGEGEGRICLLLWEWRREVLGRVCWVSRRLWSLERKGEWSGAL